MQDDHRATIRELSDRLIEAQAEIRVLDAVKWTDDIRDQFFASKYKEQPAVDADYYERNPLKFDADEVRDRFIALETEIATQLGSVTAASQLLRRTCEQYRLTIDMLVARGKPSFGSYATLLYGTPDEVFHAGGPTVIDLAESLEESLSALEPSLLIDTSAHELDAQAAVADLQARLDSSMGAGAVDVRLDDGLVADAAAGSTYIKLRSDATFSPQDLATLEAHEGWVHVGTTRNGLAQPWCNFLGKAAPPATVTQEGLATLTEMFALRSHPGRLRRIANRVRGVALVLDGATFVDLFEFFRTEGLTEDECWSIAARIFRGSTPTGPPFTKDLAYGKGLVLSYVYVRLALRQGAPTAFPCCSAARSISRPWAWSIICSTKDCSSRRSSSPEPFRDLEALTAQIRVPAGSCATSTSTSSNRSTASCCERSRSYCGR
ncbi:MAG: flavohemoglobin expression-modulating QEGLA motif protein [Acidimicrobiales bacterium]